MTSLDAFGSFEMPSLREATRSADDVLSSLHGSFESSLSAVADTFDGVEQSFNEGVAMLTGLEDKSIIQSLRPSIMDQAEIMLEGFVDANGNQTLGLNELSSWSRNTEYWDQNTRQQAGYAAEIISTAKENIQFLAEGSELTTYRADDRLDLGFVKNDQYVDKIRVNAAGEVIEKIQTKFVGNNGGDWVKRMMSNEFEKYLDGAVDKLECPSDYFDDAKAYISQRRADLGRQLERVTADGKDDVAESIRARIDKLARIDEMIEKSTVSMDEARYAREHPKRYVAKLFATETFLASVEEGKYGAVTSAGLTFVTSSVIHGSELMDGEITTDEMVKEIAAEVGTAGAIGGATGFVSAAVANAMQSSSCNLIRSVGGSCLPACAVSFAVESYDSVSDYAQGAIGVDELAYDLGHNAATMAGGTAVGVKAGAVAGTVFGPGGTIAGGLMGGLVGSAVASSAYVTAMEYAPDAAQEIATQVETYAREAMAVIESEYPEQAYCARAAFNEFFAINNVPVSI